MSAQELGHFVLQGVKDERFVIAHETGLMAELLHDRATAFANSELPPNNGMGLSARRQKMG